MGLANTLTDIANLALASIGEDLINDIEGDSDPARHIRNQLSETIREVQLIVHWPELLKWDSPTAHTEKYNQSSDIYKFYLPPALLEIVTVEDQNGYEIQDWFLEESYLITKEATPRVKYKEYTENVALWSARMVLCIYRKLALDTCMQLSDNANLLKVALQQYEFARAEAMKIQSRSRHYLKNRSAFGLHQHRRMRYQSHAKGFR